MKYLLILFMTIGSYGCSSYVQRMHAQIDGSGGPRYKKPKKDLAYKYKNKNPRTLTNPAQRVSSRSRKSYNPSVKRYYSQPKRRYKAEDLVDKESTGSLWTGNGQESFLFSKNNFKQNGDIVIVNVMKILKSEISTELARAFPPPPPKEGEKGKEPAAAKKEADKATNDSEPKDLDSKVFDKVSSVVIEEVNSDHLLVRGRKDILYRNAKRTIELQALVSRRDITDDDTVNSNNIIESSITVLR